MRKGGSRSGMRARPEQAARPPPSPGNGRDRCDVGVRGGGTDAHHIAGLGDGLHTLDECFRRRLTNGHSSARMCGVVHHCGDELLDVPSLAPSPASTFPRPCRDADRAPSGRLPSRRASFGVSVPSWGAVPMPELPVAAVGRVIGGLPGPSSRRTPQVADVAARAPNRCARVLVVVALARTTGRSARPR